MEAEETALEDAISRITTKESRVLWFKLEVGGVCEDKESSESLRADKRGD